MIPVYITIFASIAAIIGAFFQYHEKEEQKKKALINQEKADSFNALLLKSQNDLIEAQNFANQKQELVIEAQKESKKIALKLVTAQKEMIKTQGELLKEIIGDGYIFYHLYKSGKFLSFYGVSKSESKIHVQQMVAINTAMLLPLFKKNTNGTFQIEENIYNRYIKVIPESFTLSPKEEFKSPFDIFSDVLPNYITIETKTSKIMTRQYTIITKEGNFIKEASRIYSVTEHGEDFLYKTEDNVEEAEFENHFLFKKKLILLNN